MAAIFIDTGDFDESAFPIPPKRVEPSAEVCNHTPTPHGYFAMYEWAERAMKTHRQIRCPRCGLLHIWLPKAEAKAYEKQQAKEFREFNKMMQKRWGPTGEQRYKQELKAAHKRGEIE